MVDEIRVGDCAVELARMEENSVHLIVTSPPYYNARPEYAEWASYKDYLRDVEGWLRACYRVLIPGRRMVWNVGVVSDAVASNGLYPIPHDSVRIAIDNGWVFRSEIYWYYPARSAFAPLGSFPRGPSVLPLRSVESLLILQKPGGETQEKREPVAEELKPYDYMDNDFCRTFVHRQVWVIPPETDRRHPAPFPEALVEPCVRMWSRPDEIVLDPFAGSGTTAVVAMKWKRHYIGIERNPDYARMAEHRIEKRRIELLTRQLLLPNLAVAEVLPEPKQMAMVEL